MKKICLIVLCLSFLKIIYAYDADRASSYLHDRKVRPEEFSRGKNGIKMFFNTKRKSCVNRSTRFYAKIDPENVSKQLNFRWDFGDGTQAEGRTVAKIYSDPGIYWVKLTAYDNLSREIVCSVQNEVQVDTPPQANAGEDISVCLGKSVILDGSSSKVSSFLARCFNCSSLAYTWSFGDGTPDAQGVKVRHTYTTPGSYKATLTVYDGKTKGCSVSTDDVLVLVNNRPELILKEVKGACIGQNIDFAVFLNASAGRYLRKDALIYTWDFGDGSITNGPAHMAHAYAKGGEYLVKVTADDQLGTECSIATQTIRVRVNTPPVADTGPNLVCCANVESVFDGSASFDPDGDALSYVWNFGDGKTAEGARVTHVYKKRGKYKVLLKVSDNSGTKCNSSTDQLEVSVSEKPVSKMKIY